MLVNTVYEKLMKPYMFGKDAEKAHHQTMSLMKTCLRLPGGGSFLKSQLTLKDPRFRREIMGLSFPNPIGLAAGFDKDAKYVDLIPYLGFGFAEIGTVTPKPQTGNEKPRLFRLVEDEALINRMGFNNDGVEAMVRRLEERKNRDFIIGGNIGKNKDTPNEEAFRDYVTCFDALKHHVDFFVINVSSPNTPGLRELQNKENLSKILNSVQDRNDVAVPVLLKVAPDMESSMLEDVVGVVTQTGMSGIISHNTTIRRDNLKTSVHTVKSIGAGGLSGRPLAEMFSGRTEMTRGLLSGNKVLISSGGIHDSSAVLKNLRAGADLVEVYTGLIYQGPGFIKKILRTLLAEISE